MHIYEETNRFRSVFNWIVDVAVVLSAAWFFVFALGTQILATGQSMSPVIEQGETVLMNRLSYLISGPERLDLVAFEKEEGNYQIKRVIGLPGETVQIQDGFIYIDGEMLHADDDLNRSALAGQAEHPIHLKEDEYFLLGDNRENSEDSRFSSIGNVKRRQIKGQAWLRFSPFERFGFIGGK